MSIRPVQWIAGALALYGGHVAWNQMHPVLQGPAKETAHLAHMMHTYEEYSDGNYRQGLTPYPWFNEFARDMRKLAIHGPFGLFDEFHNVGLTIDMFLKALTSEESLLAMAAAYIAVGNKLFVPFKEAGKFAWNKLLVPAANGLAQAFSGGRVLRALGNGISWMLISKPGLLLTAGLGLFYMRFDGVYSGRTSMEVWGKQPLEVFNEAYAGDV
ncbi:MAG: hypothetical protein U0003_05540 [Vampirovibrionales bacterium]